VSLGSDDSGIICSSETGSGTRESSVEHLTSINVSHESLSEKPLPLECEKSTNGDSPSHSPNKGFLLRLLESKLFDMSMAISYLFNRYMSLLYITLHSSKRMTKKLNMFCL